MAKLSFTTFLGLLLMVCLCLAVVSVRLLQYRFGGYDLSPLIDSGWRVYQGQVPNRDFICTFPPVLYLAVALAFSTIGVKWIAISITGAVLPMLLTGAGLRVLYILRSDMHERRLRWLASIYSVLQMTPLLAVGFPWHSFWTESIALYAILTTFALPLVCIEQRRIRLEMLIHLCFGQCLLLLAKPNVAFPVLVFSILSLLAAKRTRAALIAITGGVALSSLALLCVHTSLLATFTVYSQLTSRFRPGSYFRGIFYDKDLAVGLQHWIIYVAVLPSAVWLLVRVFRRATVPRWLSVLALGSGVAAWVGAGTNVEFRLVDAPCLVLGAALVVTLRPSSIGRAATSWAAYTLFAIALFYGFSRARMQEIGVWAEAESCGSEAKANDQFFGTFTSCRNLFSVLEETDAAIRAARTSSVFFGPRMEFLYARERLASPRGLPLWWHPGSSYPFRAEPQILSAFERDQPELLIFLHADRSHMPPALLVHLSHEYEEIPHAPAPDYLDLADDPTAQIDVYRRRQPR